MNRAGLLLATCALLASVPATAQPQISRFEQDDGGAAVFTNGYYSLDFAVSPEGGIGPAVPFVGGSYQLQPGFYTNAASGGFGGAGRAFASLFSASAPSCPPANTRQISDLLLGIGAAQPVCVGFSKLLANSPVPLTVRLVRDSAGQVQSTPVLATLIVEAAQRLLVSPAAAWASNSTYAIDISTDFRDAEGFPLSSTASFRFQIVADPTKANTFVAADDPQTRLTLNPNVLPAAGSIEINSNPQGAPQRVNPAAIAAANNKLSALSGGLGQVHVLREINYYDAFNQPQPLALGAAVANLSMPVLDVNGDGLIDGSHPPRPVATARIYVLDEVSALWVRLPNTVPSAGSVATAPPHLSVFAVVSSADSGLADAHPFPVPFRPHGPNAGTGAGQTGTTAAGITFVNLPAPATVEVFNLRGERVWRGTESAGSGSLNWNVRDSAGAPAASGVYVYVIKNGEGQSTTGKLAVIR